MITIPKFKLVGPGTDIPGLFSGPLYYYLLAPVYFVTSYNPNAAALLLIVINLTGIYLLYEFGKSIEDRKIGILAAFLWAISYEQANYSRFISNPSFISIACILFFYGAFQYFIKKKNKGLLLSIIGVSIAIQLDFYLVYLLLLYPAFYWIYKPHISQNVFIKNFMFLFLLLSNFLIAELRFKFIGIKSLLSYLETQSGWNNIMDSFAMYFMSFSRSLYYSFFAFNNFIALILFLVSVIYVIFQKKLNSSILFLIIWLFSTLPLFAFKSNVVGGNFIHSSIAGSTTILVAYTIFLIFKVKRKSLGYLLLGLIFVFNLRLFIKEHFESRYIFSHQPMKYAQQKELVDYTYTKADNKPFSICSVSNPLFINQLWSTIYKIYGERKYSYLPYWSGPKQEISKSFLDNDINHTPTRYLIIEPSNQYPPSVIEASIFQEDKISKIVEIKKFGELIIQKRSMLLPQERMIDSQKLSDQKKLEIKQILDKDFRYSCFHTY